MMPLHPNPTKPEPKIFVHYSPVIPLISGNPVTNISLIFLDRFVEDFLDYGINKEDVISTGGRDLVHS